MELLLAGRSSSVAWEVTVSSRTSSFRLEVEAKFTVFVVSCTTQWLKLSGKTLPMPTRFTTTGAMLPTGRVMVLPTV